VRKVIRSDGPFYICPVQADGFYSNDFGAPRYTGGYHPHQGNDIFADLGSPIVAPFEGRAVVATNRIGGLAVKVFGEGGYVYNAHLVAFGTDQPHFVGSDLFVHAGAVILLLNRAMRPSVPSPQKLTTYECGVEAQGTDWSQMNIRYYVFAFLFVIFDVEAIFLFPWAIVYEQLGLFVVVEMILFVVILFFGLIYAWRRKVLDWV
jgi:NADH-quinone oxidoreductase subunit A